MPPGAAGPGTDCTSGPLMAYLPSSFEPAAHRQGGFRVRRLGRVGEGYAAFETYPAAVVGAIRGGRPTGEARLTAGPGPHWLVVAFESISHVTLSAQEGEALEDGAG